MKSNLNSKYNSLKPSQNLLNSISRIENFWLICKISMKKSHKRTFIFNNLISIKAFGFSLFHIHTLTHTHTYTYTKTKNPHTFTHIDMPIHKHTHSHTQRHAHTQTHTHTQTNKQLRTRHKHTKTQKTHTHIHINKCTPTENNLILSSWNIYPFLNILIQKKVLFVIIQLPY